MFNLFPIFTLSETIVGLFAESAFEWDTVSQK